LAESLHDTVGIEEDLAYWAVESWALALGVITQPITRQKIIQPKQDTLPLPVLAPSTRSIVKQNQRLSLIIFFMVWLIGIIFVIGVFAFFSKIRQDIKTPIARQTQKFEEPQIYPIESERRSAWTENNIGDAYYHTKNYSKAAEWYFKSAQQGDALAQCNLAFMYFNGYGVAKDYPKALQWYTKAAEQGNADGQNNLGIMYEYGYGVVKDKQKAVAWYSKAVEQGHYGAQQALKNLLGKSGLVSDRQGS
jgi:TPR repeat protein